VIVHYIAIFQVINTLISTEELANCPLYLNLKFFAFRCTMMILHLSRKRRNITRIDYNARESVSATAACGL